MLPSCSRVLVTYAKYVGARTREPGYSTGDEGSLQQDPPQRGTGKARGTPPIITSPIIAAVSNVSQSGPAALQRAAHAPRHEWHYPGFQHILPLLEAALLGRIPSSAQLTWLSVGPCHRLPQAWLGTPAPHSPLPKRKRANGIWPQPIPVVSRFSETLHLS